MALAQEKWDLRKLVEYAMQNNISVKRQDIQARLSELTYEQSRLSQFPTANIQNSSGYQFGRNIDPTSNQFTNSEILFVNHSLNLGVDIFNWFSKKNTVAANRFGAQAAKADVDKLKNDIALNVANGYLQVLLNGEQVKISEVQVQQSLEQVSITGKQVDAGSLPELNLLELQTQLANDSTTLLTAQANYTLSILQLKALLNIPADAPFIIETPNADQIPVESLAELDPQNVYQLAIKNLPQQRANEFRLLAAQKNAEAAKGRLYPSLSGFGGLDTRYSNAQKQYVKSFTGVTLPIGFVDVGGDIYTVNTNTEKPSSFGKNTYFRQVSNNFNQSIGLALSIPILNGGTARTNLKRAQLNVKDVELQKELASQTIKQDIYQAHASALAALQKFNSSTKSVATAEKAYDYAKKRYDIGLLNTIDLITNQNNLFRAKINLVSAQYDYVFKMKVLEFYKGQGIKL
ncbi:MAG: TolC family protein [Chitinophagaceae bacterium]|nr:TolC family protein [Chitinophagaceae bacterium]